MTKVEARVRNHPAVEDISDERHMGDGIWVYLKDGWINTNLQCTCVHEQNWTACEQELKHYVKPGSYEPEGEAPRIGAELDKLPRP